LKPRLTIEDRDAGHGRHPPLVEIVFESDGQNQSLRPTPAAAAAHQARGSRGPAAVRITPAMSSVTRTITEDDAERHHVAQDDAKATTRPSSCTAAM
jgi:hypothetical protein